MARKDLLKGLMGEQPATTGSKARPRYTKGAIGAVSKSIADLKSRSVIDIDPFAIEAGGVNDRLELEKEDDDRLLASIREYGQQVPVLVRPHPEHEGKYQIVYGRRRVLAMRDLGQPVKAMIRDLDDQSLVIAQGQENTARRDLSFIERANFARQMVDAGYDRKTICDALTVDKTVISRMLAIAQKLPVELIEAIGSAPGVGRDRWTAFADLWAVADADAETATSMINVTAGAGSDGRFEAVHRWLSGRVEPVAKPKRRPGQRPERTTLRDTHGRPFGAVVRSKRDVTITIKSSATNGFDTWLAENIDEIHRDWQKQRDE